MRRRFRILALTFWPGLAQIWAGQEVLGLFLALFFALTVNLFIVARWIWVEAFAPGSVDFLAALALFSWLLSLAYTFWWVALCHPDRHRQEIERLFREAHEAYLQGRWTEAIRRIERVLARDETDSDALMQLGSIYLRTQEKSLARHAFVQCLESRDGSKWRWEIQQALVRLDQK
jgi:cytochrome c-type biogenesis protein CcmH/NrfG